MMVVVHGGIRVRHSEVPAIAALAARFVEQVHLEPGCLAYELSWDVADPQFLRLLEHWEDEAAYATHRDQVHVAAWVRAIKAAQESPVSTIKLHAKPRGEAHD